MAWRLAVDASRTLVPLQYPPHVVALASIYTAALLVSFEQPPPPPQVHGTSSFRTAHELVEMLGQSGPWETRFHTWTEDIDGKHCYFPIVLNVLPFTCLSDIGHSILDLLIHVAQNPQSSTSPSTPQSPSPHLSASHARAQSSIQAGIIEPQRHISLTFAIGIPPSVQA